jgi:hypothetical protein
MTKPQIDENGHQKWYNRTGKLHREDGPAVIYNNSYTRWFLNDVRYTSNKSFQEAANLTDEDMTAMILKYGNVGLCDLVGISTF